MSKMYVLKSASHNSGLKGVGLIYIYNISCLNVYCLGRKEARIYAGSKNLR